MACAYDIDQTDDPKKLLGLLRELDEEAGDRYFALHQEWEKNLLFWMGKQWLEQKKGTDGYSVLEEDDDHYRPVTNYIVHCCDLKRSQVLGKQIRAVVKPNSENRDDITAARLGYLVLKATHVIDDEDALNNLVFLHSQIFGLGWRADFKQPVPYEFLEQPVTETVNSPAMQCTVCGQLDDPAMYQDPSMGACTKCGGKSQLIDNSVEQMAIDPATGMPRINKIPVFHNVTKVMDPFRIRTSKAATEKDLQFIDDVCVQSVSWLKAAYATESQGYKPDQIEKIKPMDGMPRCLKISENFKNSVSFAHSSVAREVQTGSVQSKGKDETVFHKTYFPPSEKHSMGRLLCWTPTALLYDGMPDIPNNPKLKRWHPYTPYHFKIHPMRFEGEAYVTDLISLAKQVNSMDSMILDHLDSSAQPLRVEYGNVQTNNDDNSNNTLVIDARPELPSGGAPFYLQNPQLANEVYRTRGEKIAEMEKLGRVSDVVQGMRPAGVDTWRGLELLRDAADRADSELYQRWFEYIRKSAQLKLAILQECLINRDPDLLEEMDIIRKNENLGMEEVKQFIGADLRNNLNVNIESGDYASMSKAAEADKVANLLQSGLLSPQAVQDPYTQMLLMRKFGMGDMPFPDRQDIEKAERIQEYLESGSFQQAMQILSIRDNKSLQLRVWSEWMKTSRFESLDPQIKAAAEQLVKGVEMQLVQAQQAAMAQAQSMNPPMGGGMPSAPGAGSSPPGQPMVQ